MTRTIDTNNQHANAQEGAMSDQNETTAFTMDKGSQKKVADKMVSKEEARKLLPAMAPLPAIFGDLTRTVVALYAKVERLTAERDALVAKVSNESALIAAERRGAAKSLRAQAKRERSMQKVVELELLADEYESRVECARCGRTFWLDWRNSDNTLCSGCNGRTDGQ